MTIEVDTKTQFNKLLDGLLDESANAVLEGEKNVTETESDDVSLYQLLDEVSGGRKLMNCLFRDVTPIDNMTLTKSWNDRENPFNSHSRRIARDWHDEEQQSSSQLNTSMAFQNDAPVIFQWSHKASNTRDISAPNSPEIKRSRGFSESKKETTNQRLFNDALKNIRELNILRPSWETIISDVDESSFDNNTGRAYSNGMTSIATSETGKNNPSWKDPSFKVDPLQKFVVKELPKEKKPSADKPGKHKSKKGVLWFLKGGHHHKKPAHKTKKDNIDLNIENKTIDTSSTAPIANNIPKTDVDRHDTLLPVSYTHLDVYKRQHE